MSTVDTKPMLTDGGAEQLTWLARMRAEQSHWVDATGGHHVFRYADVQQPWHGCARGSTTSPPN